jgi:hypothetical protein
MITMGEKSGGSFHHWILKQFILSRCDFNNILSDFFGSFSGVFVHM